MSLGESSKSLIKLAIPIIMGQIGLMLIGAGDVFIASLYSKTSVAAIGVANGVINPVFLFGVGLMMGISPSLAIRRGEGDQEKRDLGSILVYSVLIGICTTLVTLIINLMVPHIGLAEELIQSVQAYNQIVAWSFPFAIMFTALKEYLQAYEDVMIPNIMNIFAVFINLAVNYLLVFGHGRFEGIGEVGLAWASFFTRALLFIFILIYALKHEIPKSASSKFHLETFKFSLPIAFMFFLEVLAFCSVSILSGKLSVLAAATNNIILTMASVSFMIPMSIASALAVKIGHAYGEKDLRKLKNYTNSGILLGLLYASFAAFTFFLIPDVLMSLMSPEEDVIALGVSLLKIVAIFQFVDSMQVIITGILRGMKYVNIVSMIVFAGYWLIGIPYGVYLAFFTDNGIHGLWIGLALSLAIVAISLGSYLKYKIKSLLLKEKEALQ
jgi:MATE family multidrug resistance protein